MEAMDSIMEQQFYANQPYYQTWPRRLRSLI
jgi:hypothetical protein